MMSPVFFISAAVTIVCCYVVSPNVASGLVQRDQLQKLGHKSVYFHSYLASALHAVVAFVLAGHTLATGDLSSDKIFATSSAGTMALHVTIGYTVGDTVVCLLDPYLRGAYSTVLHHLAVITGIAMCLYHQLFMFFVVYRLLSEFSTPFVDLRAVISAVGDKKGWLYMLASLGMMISFFLCRIVVIPWHNYELFTALFGVEGSEVPWYLTVFMALNFTIFDVLNLIWFCKILRGGYKLLFLTKHSAE